MIDYRIEYKIDNETMAFLQKPRTARSARPQGYRQSGITRFGLVPQALDIYSVWPPPGALDRGASSACGNGWLKFLLSRALTRSRVSFSTK